MILSSQPIFWPFFPLSSSATRNILTVMIGPAARAGVGLTVGDTSMAIRANKLMRRSILGMMEYPFAGFVRGADAGSGALLRYILSVVTSVGSPAVWS